MQGTIFTNAHSPNHFLFISKETAEGWCAFLLQESVAFSDPEIFSAFARDFLNIELEITEVIQEKTFSPPIGRVNARFDLFAEDRKHRTIIDIQHERYSDHYHRFLHYQCAALLELAANFQEYRPRVSVFTLVVLTSSVQILAMQILAMQPLSVLTLALQPFAVLSLAVLTLEAQTLITLVGHCHVRQKKLSCARGFKHSCLRMLFK